MRKWAVVRSTCSGARSRAPHVFQRAKSAAAADDPSALRRSQARAPRSGSLWDKFRSVVSVLGAGGAAARRRQRAGADERTYPWRRTPSAEVTDVELFSEELLRKNMEIPGAAETVEEYEDEGVEIMVELLEGGAQAYKKHSHHPLVRELAALFRAQQEAEQDAEQEEMAATDFPVPKISEDTLHEIFSKVDLSDIKETMRQIQVRRMCKRIANDPQEYEGLAEEPEIASIVERYFLEARASEVNVAILEEFQRLLHTEQGSPGFSHVTCADVFRLCSTVNKQGALEELVSSDGEYVGVLREYLIYLLKAGSLPQRLEALATDKFFQQQVALSGLSPRSLLHALLRDTRGFVSAKVLDLYSIQEMPLPFVMAEAADGRLQWRCNLRAFHSLLQQREPTIISLGLKRGSKKSTLLNYLFKSRFSQNAECIDHIGVDVIPTTSTFKRGFHLVDVHGPILQFQHFATLLGVVFPHAWVFAHVQATATAEEVARLQELLMHAGFSERQVIWAVRDVPYLEDNSEKDRYAEMWDVSRDRVIPCGVVEETKDSAKWYLEKFGRELRHITGSVGERPRFPMEESSTDTMLADQQQGHQYYKAIEEELVELCEREQVPHIEVDTLPQEVHHLTSMLHNVLEQAKEHSKEGEFHRTLFPFTELHAKELQSRAEHRLTSSLEIKERDEHVAGLAKDLGEITAERSRTRVSALCESVRDLALSPKSVDFFTAAGNTIASWVAPRLAPLEKAYADKKDKERQLRDRLEDPRALEGQSEETVTEWKEELAELTIDCQKLDQRLSSETVSPDLCIRELAFAAQCRRLKPNRANQTSALAEELAFLVGQGYPIEVLDGDHLTMQAELLESTFSTVQGKLTSQGSQVNPFFVSVIGPQSSGKSTLLNFLFGSQFNARAGRCTKGLYTSILPTDSNGFANPLCILDTEGLLSIERSDPMFDKKIMLFTMAMSQVVLINVNGEINASMMNILAIALFALDRLKFDKVRPRVLFVLRNMADLNIQTQREMINGIRTRCFEQLQGKTDANISELLDFKDYDSFFLMPSAYNLDSVAAEDGDTILQTKQVADIFIQRTELLRQKVIMAARERAETQSKADMTFSSLDAWVKRAAKVWRSIEEFSDIFDIDDVDQLQKRESLSRFYDKEMKAFSVEWEPRLLDALKESEDRLLEGKEAAAEEGRFAQKIALQLSESLMKIEDKLTKEFPKADFGDVLVNDFVDNIRRAKHSYGAPAEEKFKMLVEKVKVKSEVDKAKRAMFEWVSDRPVQFNERHEGETSEEQKRQQEAQVMEEFKQKWDARKALLEAELWEKSQDEEEVKADLRQQFQNILSTMPQHEWAYTTTFITEPRSYLVDWVDGESDPSTGLPLGMPHVQDMADHMLIAAKPTMRDETVKRDKTWEEEMEETLGKDTVAMKVFQFAKGIANQVANQFAGAAPTQPARGQLPERSEGTPKATPGRSSALSSPQPSQPPNGREESRRHNSQRARSASSPQAHRPSPNGWNRQQQNRAQSAPGALGSSSPRSPTPANQRGRKKGKRQSFRGVRVRAYQPGSAARSPPPGHSGPHIEPEVQAILVASIEHIMRRLRKRVEDIVGNISSEVTRVQVAMLTEDIQKIAGESLAKRGYEIKPELKGQFFCVLMQLLAERKCASQKTRIANKLGEFEAEKHQLMDAIQALLSQGLGDGQSGQNFAKLYLAKARELSLKAAVEQLYAKLPEEASEGPEELMARCFDIAMNSKDADEVLIWAVDLPRFMKLKFTERFDQKVGELARMLKITMDKECEKDVQVAIRRAQSFVEALDAPAWGDASLVPPSAQGAVPELTAKLRAAFKDYICTGSEGKVECNGASATLPPWSHKRDIASQIAAWDTLTNFTGARAFVEGFKSELERAHREEAHKQTIEVDKEPYRLVIEDKCAALFSKAQGCQKTCVYCGAKCNSALGLDAQHTHRCEHRLPAFNGCFEPCANGKKAWVVDICDSPANFKKRWVLPSGYVRGTEDPGIKQRCSDVGAATGCLTFRLSWDSKADLDLHLVPPDCTEEIWYGYKGPVAGGLLDHDDQAGDPGAHVENIYWLRDPPMGVYKVWVHNYAHRDVASPFTLQILNTPYDEPASCSVRTFSDTLTSTKLSSTVWTYEPGITFEEHITHTSPDWSIKVHQGDEAEQQKRRQMQMAQLELIQDKLAAHFGYRGMVRVEREDKAAKTT